MIRLNCIIIFFLFVSIIGCHNSNKFEVEKLLEGFVKVEGGRFMMGSADTVPNLQSDEVQHEVEVATFHMQATEVTQELYELVMGSNPSSKKEWKDMPVTDVSWEDAQEFITKLNEITGGKYRLPTEAEWEYAARGGNRSQGYVYSGSNNIEEVAWYQSNSGEHPHVVKEKKPNELGLYDMTGNVWEWCSDWYADYRLDAKGSVNPQGADNGSYRVIRGGSWFNQPENCRVAYRLNYNPQNRHSRIGFRLVFSE